MTGGAKLALLTSVAVAAAGGLAWTQGWGSAEPDDVVTCEEATKALLKAPSTYKRVDASRLSQQNGVRLFLRYDAANSFGTPLRGTAVCEFPSGTSAETDDPELIAMQMNGSRITEMDVDFQLAKATGELAAMKR